MMPTNLLLLPYEPQTLLVNKKEKLRLLMIIQFFIKTIIETIDLFYFKKEYNKFDPHLGDTLCQVRAYQTLLLINQANKSENILVVNDELHEFRVLYHLISNNITNFKQLIDNNASKYIKELDMSEKLYDFLNRQKLVFDITENTFFLVQSYLLTSFSIKNEENISLAINYKELSLCLGVGQTSARKVVRQMQNNLSFMSCNFVKQLFSDYSAEKGRSSILFLLKLTDHQGRQVLPCYETTRIIINHALKRQSPILIVIHRKFLSKSDVIYLLFTPHANKDGFEMHKNIDQANQEQSCIVIHGITTYDHQIEYEFQEDFIQRFQQIGLKNIILANMAKHPQYSAKEFESISQNPFSLLFTKICSNLNFSIKNNAFQSDFSLALAQEMENELIEMKSKAEHIGCYIEESSLFFIQHVFCDTIKNQLINKNTYVGKRPLKVKEINYTLKDQLNTYN
ncbi:MAG TPA: hypothetical protein VHZ76_09880 [Gammaproteobacteria bacterium]|jgi:hypothetical protein|nr:hypothetical protein [Gammaproteobacteria bacterium]